MFRIPLRVQSSTECPSGFEVDNLLNRTTATLRPWRAGGNDQLSAIFQFPHQLQISRLCIGNHFSQMVEVFVGKTCDGLFKSLVPEWVAMTRTEADNWRDGERMAVYSKDQFLCDVREKQWDLIKVRCFQPFHRGRQFGLLLLEVYSTENAQDPSLSITSAPSTPKSSFFEKIEEETFNRRWHKKLEMVQREMRRKAFRERQLNIVSTIREARLAKREASRTSIESSISVPTLPSTRGSAQIGTPARPRTTSFRFISDSRQKQFFEMLRDPYSTSVPVPVVVKDPASRGRVPLSSRGRVPLSSRGRVPLSSRGRVPLSSRGRVPLSSREGSIAGKPSAVLGFCTALTTVARGSEKTHVHAPHNPSPAKSASSANPSAKTDHPSTHLRPCLPLANVVFTLGNFSGVRYNEIMRKAMRLGAIYKPIVSHHHTHAIVSDKRDPLVLDKDIHFHKVLPLWLDVCKRVNGKVDEELYTVG